MGAGARKGKADKKEARKARKQAAQEEEEAGLRRGAPTPEELARVGAHIPVRCFTPGPHWLLVSIPRAECLYS